MLINSRIGGQGKSEREFLPEFNDGLVVRGEAAGLKHTSTLLTPMGLVVDSMTSLLFPSPYVLLSGRTKV